MASVFWKAIVCASLAVALPLSAQEEKLSAPQEKAPAQEKTRAAGRRFSYGFRLEAFPLRLFDRREVTSYTTNPIAEYDFSETSSSQKAAPGASVMYRWTAHYSVGGEFFLHHAKYTAATDVYSGIKDPNATTDDRPMTRLVQTTRANYWVVPLFVRYEHIPMLQGVQVFPWIPGKRLVSQALSHAYATGGIEFRHVGRIRTGNDTIYPDNTTDYNETPATPSHRNQFGAVVGIGLHFKDELGIQLTPEIRFVRWQNSTFQGPAFKGELNQAEAGVGLSF
jgi:hypothetical protein